MKTKTLSSIALVLVFIATAVLSAGCGPVSLVQVAVALAEAKKTQKTVACSGCDVPVAGAILYKEGETYKIGDIVNVDGLYITVLGWKAPNIVDVAVLNRTNKDAPVYTLSQMHLLDDAGNSFTVTPFTNVTLSVDLDKSLAPGDYVHGQVGFITNLNSTASNMIFAYDLDGSDKAEVLFALGKEPNEIPLQQAMIDAITGTTVKIGEAFQVGDIQYTITNARWPKATNVVKPMPGATFVILDMTVKNIGTVAQTFSPIAQVRIIDETLTKYQLSLTALGTEKNTYLPQSDYLKPGQTITGQIAFEVPAKASRLAVSIKDYYDGGLRAYLEVPVPVKATPTPTTNPTPTTKP